MNQNVKSFIEQIHDVLIYTAVSSKVSTDRMEMLTANYTITEEIGCAGSRIQDF